MKKTGGFKLAIEKKRGYYFEIVAALISILLLSLVVYSVIFSTGVIRKVFDDSGVTPQSNTVLDIDGANSLKKIKEFSVDNLKSPDVSPPTSSSPFPIGD